MGVANSLNTGALIALSGTLTTGGAVTFSGAHAFIGVLSADTNVTFPTSGTLATTSQLPSLPLSATDGGSGVSNPTAHGVLIAEGASAFTPIVLGAGQVLIGTTSSDPVAGAIGSGAGILVGNSSGAITVTNTGVTSNVATANQTTVSGATGAVTIGIASNAILPGTGGVTLPTGNTAARAGSAGTIRFNSQTNVFECTIDGSAWATIETSATGVLSVSGTTNRITSTGGTTPVIDISASYVGQSSITTLGTIGTGVWNGTVIVGTYGGTGVNNGASTITIGGNVAFSGAFTFAGTVSANTTVTFPTSGLLLSDAAAVTVAQGGTGLQTMTTPYAVICAGTTATGVLQPLAALGAAGTVLTSNGASALPSFQAVGGGTSLVVQRVSTLTGAVATGTTGLPLDDTIPQSGEGDQFMTLAITPINSSHILVITVTVFGADSAASSYEGFIAALFQDSTANALAAMFSATSQFAGNPTTLTFTYIMTAGTTSATTFKVRAGDPTGTFTFNGQAGGRLFGGVIASSITITEYTT